MNLGKLTIVKVKNAFNINESGEEIKLENLPGEDYTVSLLDKKGNHHTFERTNKGKLIDYLTKEYNKLKELPVKIVYSKFTRNVEKFDWNNPQVQQA